MVFALQGDGKSSARQDATIRLPFRTRPAAPSSQPGIVGAFGPHPLLQIGVLMELCWFVSDAPSLQTNTFRRFCQGPKRTRCNPSLLDYLQVSCVFLATFSWNLPGIYRILCRSFWVQHTYLQPLHSAKAARIVSKRGQSCAVTWAHHCYISASILKPKPNLHHVAISFPS